MLRREGSISRLFWERAEPAVVLHGVFEGLHPWLNLLRLPHWCSQKSHMDLFCRIQVTDDLELIGILMVTILRDEKFPFLTCLPVILSFSRCVPFLLDLQVGLFLTWAVYSQLFFPISPEGDTFPVFPYCWFPIPRIISLGISSLEQKVVVLGDQGIGIVVFSWNVELCVIAKVMLRVWLGERANFREWNQQKSWFKMNKILDTGVNILIYFDFPDGSWTHPEFLGSDISQWRIFPKPLCGF